jgi:hypothetical protein
MMLRTSHMDDAAGATTCPDTETEVPAIDDAPVAGTGVDVRT